MNLQDIPPEELNWTKEPVIGLCLMNAVHDSEGNPINPNVYYRVAKYTKTGMMVILPTERNMKHEFANEMLSKNNRFN